MIFGSNCHCTSSYNQFLYLNQSSAKGSKLLRYVEHRLRVTLVDGRTLSGTFLAFDKHLNLVLADTEEFRTLRPTNKTAAKTAVVEERTEKRSLGLVILRGENVVSIAVEGPPPPGVGGSNVGKATPGGPGVVAVGAGRGVMPTHLPPPAMMGRGMAPVGLGPAPIHGVGAPANMMPGMMMAPPPSMAVPMGMNVMGVGPAAPIGGMGMGRGMPMTGLQQQPPPMPPGMSLPPGAMPPPRY
jgi:small nuclear ribonucleoprotein B and B'